MRPKLSYGRLMLWRINTISPRVWKQHGRLAAGGSNVQTHSPTNDPSVVIVICNNNRSIVSYS